MQLSFVWIAQFTALQQVAINVWKLRNTKWMHSLILIFFHYILVLLVSSPVLDEINNCLIYFSWGILKIRLPFGLLSTDGDDESKLLPFL